MTRLGLTFVHVDAGHVVGGAIEADLTLALVPPLGVLAVLVRSAWALQLLTLVHILAKRPVHQGEPWLAQAGEGARAVGACGLVPAPTVVCKTLVDVAALEQPVAGIARTTGAGVGAGQVGAQGVGVALLGLRALVHVRAGEAVALEARRALTGEGAGRVPAAGVGAAGPRRALVHVLALRVVQDEAGATVAEIRAGIVDAGGGGGADVGCRALVDVFASQPVSCKAAEAGTRKGSQPVDANGLGVTRLLVGAFVDVCARESISHEAAFARALIRARGVYAVCVLAAGVACAFVDVHAGGAVAFVATVARALVRARQVFTAFKAK